MKKTVVTGRPPDKWLKKEKERLEQELLEIGPWWWELLKRMFAL